MNKVYIKVTFSNGDWISTWINLTMEDAKTYYIGQVFNLGPVEDNMQTAIRVEEIKD